jgi:drug/metabolite transporter superfamily protein YnfA
MKLNDGLQWAGTACFMCMYTVMSLFPELHPWNVVFGALGGLFYLGWSARVANKPQTITNVVGVTICIVGLLRAWG